MTHGQHSRHRAVVDMTWTPAPGPAALTPDIVTVTFWDAVAYLFFPRCPAERARSLRRRAQDVRNNGRGPRAGEVEQWDRWDSTRQLHERGRGAFVPKESVARDTERIRSTDDTEVKIRRGRSGRETSGSQSKPFGLQTSHRKRTAMPRI